MNREIEAAIKEAEDSIRAWGRTHAFAQPVVAAVLQAKAIGVLADEIAALRKAVTERLG